MMLTAPRATLWESIARFMANCPTATHCWLLRLSAPTTNMRVREDSIVQNAIELPQDASKYAKMRIGGPAKVTTGIASPRLQPCEAQARIPAAKFVETP